METMIVDNGHVTVMLTMQARDNALVPRLLAHCRREILLCQLFELFTAQLSTQ